MYNQLELIRNILEKDKDVLLGYLFGSYAKNTQNILSDIDFAILLKENENNFLINKKMEYIGKLIEIFKVNQVDLIILNNAPIFLQYVIIKDGILVFSRNEKARVSYETTVVREFLDIKPLFDYYNKYLIKRINEGTFGVR
ncbi:MAG: nucleotidyltransferase domain-containing protein [Candidatus Helarchaeota archaeon]|nr:nucleotidyltransferase domain-containing protein [Candidatus Helarchaeota archaeon]